MKISMLYAALLAIVFFILSIRTIRLRRKLRVAVGDGGDKQLLRAMRVHSNFAEYTPFCLLLIFFVESAGASTSFVHLLGTALFFARTTHAFGVSQINENLRIRVAAMLTTFAVLLLSSGFLIYSIFL